MGADLYIKKLQKPVKEEWQPKFDAAVKRRDSAPNKDAEQAAQKLVDEAYERMYGDEFYFRDSYNATSILHRLNLSWWQDLEYDVDDEDSDVNVSAAACKRFLDKILAAPFQAITRDELLSEHAKVDDGENSPDAWNKFFAEKRQRLIAFLERAIEHGGMYASC